MFYQKVSIIESDNGGGNIAYLMKVNNVDNRFL